MKLRELLIFLPFVALACNSAQKTGPQGAATKVQPTVELRVSFNEQTMKPGKSFQVKPGVKGKLKVEVVHSNGTVSDVTTDAQTTYFSESPGQLSVTKQGEVNISEQAEGPSGVGITYGHPGDKEVGASSVLFEAERTTPGNGLLITPGRKILGIGESTQLTVKRKLQGGRMEDITAAPQTLYFTTSESELVPEPGGIATCIGTRNQPEDSASVTVSDGALSGMVTFDLRMEGPGPGLKIELEKSTLQEGESTTFSVRTKDGSVLTSRSSGTRYLVLTGKGAPDADFLSIDDSRGTIVTKKPLGRYNWLSPVIFVRNGNLVGWTQLKITRASGTPRGMK